MGPIGYPFLGSYDDGTAQMPQYPEMGSVSPIDYTQEAKKQAGWAALRDFGLALMAQSGKVGRTPAEVNPMAQVGQAGMVGAQSFDQNLAQALKNAQYQQMMGVKSQAMNNKPKPMRLGPNGTYEVYDQRTNTWTDTRMKAPEKPTAENDFNLFKTGYAKDNPNASPSEISHAWGDEAIRRKKEGYSGLGDIRMNAVVEDGKPVLRSSTEVVKGNKAGKTSTPATYDPGTKTALAEAAQAGGSTTANINDAYRTYHDLAPTMKALRRKVANDNLLPSGGFKRIEQLDQWIQDAQSNPDMADMATSIGMMSESLSRALGSSQGGQFMLEYANTLLNKNYAPDAFDRIVDRHEQTLRDKLKHRTQFGKEEMPGAPGAANPTGKGKLTDKGLALKYISAARGDKNKARQLAAQDGWEL